MTKASESIVKQIDEIRENMLSGGHIGREHSEEDTRIFGMDIVHNEDAMLFIRRGFEAVERHGSTDVAMYAVAINFMRMGYRAAMDEMASQEVDNVS